MGQVIAACNCTKSPEIPKYNLEFLDFEEEKSGKYDPGHSESNHCLGYTEALTTMHERNTVFNWKMQHACSPNKSRPSRNLSLKKH